jgi:hypothetical protein
MVARPRSAISSGTAMVETVSVLGFVLALLFGSAQIVLAGFYQLQLDAATFLYAHSYAVTNGSISPAALQSAVPVVVPNASMSTQPSAPPNTSVSDPNGLTVLGELTTSGVAGAPANNRADRYGGASIILPQQIVTVGTLDLKSFDTSIFTNPIILTAADVEGESMVVDHDDDSEGYGYNNSNSGNPANLRNPYLAYGSGGDDQNVPPYYLTMAYMDECTYLQYGFDCVPGPGSGNSSINALGLAEFLKDNSNPLATNGNYTDTGGNGIAAGQLFGAMTQHEVVYAAMAQLLVSQYPSYSDAIKASNAGNASNNAFIQCANSLQNSWDVWPPYPGNGDLGTADPQTPLKQVSASC